MVRTKPILGIVLAIALAVGQASHAAAAPQFDPLVGTIDTITQGTDSGGNTIIIVNYTDTDGNAQVAQLSVQQAVDLGLISVDPLTGAITILATSGTPINLTGIGDSADPCALPTEGAQPVGGALTSFFCGTLGVDYDTLAGWHDAGFGYGVIAQALFMAQALGGDSTLAEAILAAKSSHDFSLLGLPDDANIKNWGQLKKYVLSQEVKSLTNLGAIMSGRAQPAVTATPTTTTLSTTSIVGKGHGKSGQHGKSGEEHGKGKSK